MDLMIRPTGDDFFSCDLKMENGDLLLDGGLDTAILISLFTDRRAAPSDELPDPDGGRRGWWGDALDGGDLIGSRLWLLSRRKSTPETRRLYEEYTREALQWMLDDGLAERIEVAASWQTNSILAVNIIIVKNGGGHHKFIYSWNAQAEKMELIGNIISWS